MKRRSASKREGELGPAVIYNDNIGRYKKPEEAWNLLKKQQANLVVYAHTKPNQQFQLQSRNRLVVQINIMASAHI